MKILAALVPIPFWQANVMGKKEQLRRNYKYALAYCKVEMTEEE
jgi:hypothetical protein